MTRSTWSAAAIIAVAGYSLRCSQHPSCATNADCLAGAVCDTAAHICVLGTDAGADSGGGAPDASVDAGSFCGVRAHPIADAGNWSEVSLALGAQVAVVAYGGTQAAYSVLDPIGLVPTRTVPLSGSGALVRPTTSGFAVAYVLQDGGLALQFLDGTGNPTSSFQYARAVSRKYPLSLASDGEGAAVVWDEAVLIGVLSRLTPFLVSQPSSGAASAPVRVSTNVSGDDIALPTLGDIFVDTGCPLAFADVIGANNETFQMRTLFHDGGSATQVPMIQGTVSGAAVVTVGALGAVAWITDAGALEFLPPGATAVTPPTSMNVTAVSAPGLTHTTGASGVQYGLCFVTPLGSVVIRSLDADGGIALMDIDAGTSGLGACAIAYNAVQNRYVVAYTAGSGSSQVQVEAACLP